MVLFGLGWAILENQSFSKLKVDKILVSQSSGDILGPIIGAFMYYAFKMTFYSIFGTFSSILLILIFLSKNEI